MTLCFGITQITFYWPQIHLSCRKMWDKLSTQQPVFALTRYSNILDSVKKGRTYYEEMIKNANGERVTRSNRRLIASQAESVDGDYSEDKENTQTRSCSRNDRKVRKSVVALEQKALLHQVFEQKLELSEKDYCRGDHSGRSPVKRTKAKTPSNGSRVKKQPSTARKASAEFSVKIQPGLISASTSPTENKILITPPHSGKKTRKIRPTVSQSCSALGRKRRGLFPGC